jgi:AcrR family transcriptional regulator
MVGEGWLDVTVDEQPASRPYHHGDLRRALVAAAVELGREGGPASIVLREVARRVGVSATAAYRHFASLPDLLEEAAQESLEHLAEAMRAEQARCRPTGDPRGDAWENLRAVGRAYVHFALDEPGLFATAFSCTKPIVGPDLGIEEWEGPHRILEDALDVLIAVGSIAAADRAAAATAAWAYVHGLSELLLGPLGGVPEEMRDAAIESTMDLVQRGLLVRE